MHHVCHARERCAVSIADPLVAASRFQVGFFNGDPHPGNVLITKTELLLESHSDAPQAYK